MESRKQMLKAMLDDILKEIETNNLQLNNTLYILKMNIEHNQRHKIDDLCDDITELNHKIIALRKEYELLSSII